MPLTTSKNKTYDVIFADGPTRLSGTVMIRMQDPRHILQIGAEFDGLESFSREDMNQGDKEWTGYTELVAVRRLNKTDVLIELAKP